jgi:hypothetical protein
LLQQLEGKKQHSRHAFSASAALPHHGRQSGSAH